MSLRRAIYRASRRCVRFSAALLDAAYWDFAVLLNISTDTLLDTRNQCVVATGNAGAVVATLPPNPAFGQVVCVVDGDGQATALNITINGNGKLINGSATQVLEVDYAALMMAFNGSKWVVI